MTGAATPAPAPEPVTPPGRAGAVTVVDPAALGLPATLVLRGDLDPVTAPGLDAAVATAADTGRLHIDACGVHRFDSTTWAAVAEGCAHAVAAGIAVQITGLRWSQLLDVLATTPATQTAALMAGVRALLICPGQQPSAITPTGGADTADGFRAPGRLPPPASIGPIRVPRPRSAAGTVADHLPRDWSRPDPGTGRE